MSNEQHPITPPPELVHKLRTEAPHGIGDAGVTRELWLINSAYRAGATVPIPPSLAEQALEALDDMDKPLGVVTASRCASIRAALDRLKELEEQSNGL